MRFHLFVFLLCLRLGVSRVSNQEFAALALHVYDTSGALPQHMQDEWSSIQNITDPQIDFWAGVFKKTPSNEVVVAVRGTATLKNFLVDDAQLIWGNVPPIAQKLVDELQRISKEHPSVYLTGHSLGAAAINAAFAKLALSHDHWLERVAGVVLFENPGIQAELADDLKAKLTAAKFNKFRSTIIEFFGAPNPINMIASHIAGTQVRVLIDHGRQVNFLHGASCLLKSVGRATLWYYVLAAAVEKVASAGALMSGAAGAAEESHDIYQKWSVTKKSGLATAMCNAGICDIDVAAWVAPWVPQVGLLSAFLGLQGSQLGEWVLGQHSMTSMHQAFDREEDMPNEEKHIRMESWPSGVTLRSTVMPILLNAVPFHPANDGIHTCHDPDSVLERRISMIQGYVTKEEQR